MHELVEKIIANPFEYLGKTFNIHFDLTYRDIWMRSVLDGVFIDEPKNENSLPQFRFGEINILSFDIKEIELVEE